MQEVQGPFDALGDNPFFERSSPMSKLTIVTRALCLVTIPLLVGFAQEIVRPDVKTGLWETTVNNHINGAPPIPDDVLARMTPEQKARMMGAMGGGPHTSKACLTEEKLSKGTDFGSNDRPNCKRTILSSTAKGADVQEDCTEKDGTYAAKIHYEVTSRESANGTVHVDMNRMGKAMTIDGTFQSKWLADSCGDVK
jgi:hypothetical protein